MSSNVIHLRPVRKAKRSNPLEDFISREEYPELFGDAPKFDFDVEHEEEKKLMPTEEFDQKLKEYKERVAKEKGISIEELEETNDFEITEG